MFWLYGNHVNWHGYKFTTNHTTSCLRWNCQLLLVTFQNHDKSMGGVPLVKNLCGTRHIKITSSFFQKIKFEGHATDEDELCLVLFEDIVNLTYIPSNAHIKYVDRFAWRIESFGYYCKSVIIQHLCIPWVMAKVFICQFWMLLLASKLSPCCMWVACGRRNNEPMAPFCLLPLVSPQILLNNRSLLSC